MQKLLSLRRLVHFASGIACGAIVLISSGDAQSKAAELTVAHTLVADLGTESIEKMIHMRTPRGNFLVGWGDRVVSWSLSGTTRTKEVVPRREGYAFSNGGSAFDMDGDGFDELVVARNIGNSGAKPEMLWFDPSAGDAVWGEHHIAAFDTDSRSSPHDMQPIRFRLATGQNRHGVVAVISRHHLYWFEIPGKPTEAWVQYDIGSFPAKAGQSGMSVGDVNGDSRPDVVCGVFWVECPADPRSNGWTFHRFGTWDDNGWGGMAKNALADLDGDGVPEIITSEVEIPNARVGVFKQPAGKPDGMWECHTLASDWYCPHSVCVADLNHDRRMDIIIGEMKVGGWSFPGNANPRIVAYLNGGSLQFEKQQLSEGWGVHEMGVMPNWRGGILIFAAEEAQPTKVLGMVTNVHEWFVHP